MDPRKHIRYPICLLILKNSRNSSKFSPLFRPTSRNNWSQSEYFGRIWSSGSSELWIRISRVREFRHHIGQATMGGLRFDWFVKPQGSSQMYWHHSHGQTYPHSGLLSVFHGSKVQYIRRWRSQLVCQRHRRCRSIRFPETQK